jgi:hypothetical protein
MATTASRAKLGTLTLGTTPGEDFAGQFHAVKISNDVSKDDDVISLAGTRAVGGYTDAWKMELTAIQDWTLPTGLVEYSWAHHGEVLDFIFAPTGTTGPSYAGQLTIYALPVGGEVEKTLTDDVTWPLVGKPTRTEGTP